VDTDFPKDRAQSKSWCRDFKIRAILAASQSSAAMPFQLNRSRFILICL
jgi:hypothetical protein